MNSNVWLVNVPSGTELHINEYFRLELYQRTMIDFVKWNISNRRYNCEGYSTIEISTVKVLLWIMFMLSVLRFEFFKELNLTSVMFVPAKWFLGWSIESSQWCQWCIEWLGHNCDITMDTPSTRPDEDRRLLSVDPWEFAISTVRLSPNPHGSRILLYIVEDSIIVRWKSGVVFVLFTDFVCFSSGYWMKGNRCVKCS